MKITVRNLQKKHRLNLKAIRLLTADLAVQLGKQDPETDWEEVALLLADDAGITEIHRTFFGKDGPTDVISFRYEPVPGETGSGGEVIVNVECAVREGAVREGAGSELGLYIAHGLNHLSGAEDNTPARRAAMRRREKSWLGATVVPLQDMIRKD